MQTGSLFERTVQQHGLSHMSFKMREPRNVPTERSVCDLKSSKGDNASLASRRKQEEVLLDP